MKDLKLPKSREKLNRLRKNQQMDNLHLKYLMAILLNINNKNLKKLGSE